MVNDLQRKGTQPFRSLWYGLQNFWAYRSLIYRDRDWDWAYLYQMIEFKILRMSKLQREHGVHTTATQLAEEMEEAASILKRLYEDAYPYQDSHFKDYLEMQKEDLKRFCQLFEKKSKGWWD